MDGHRDLLMTLIVFDCDRCEEPVRGLHTALATGGFYVVSTGHAFSQFGREGEHFVCDECIQKMPEWQAVYG